jgi:hypothetical protein
MGQVAAGRGSARPIGVGVIGSGWTGKVHSQAYARVRHHFPDLELPSSSEQQCAPCVGITKAFRNWIGTER